MFQIHGDEFFELKTCDHRFKGRNGIDQLNVFQFNWCRFFDLEFQDPEILEFADLVFKRVLEWVIARKLAPERRIRIVNLESSLRLLHVELVLDIVGTHLRHKGLGLIILFCCNLIYGSVNFLE